VPFGLEPWDVTVDLAPVLERREIGFIAGRVREIMPGRRLVSIEPQHAWESSLHSYDALVVATGAQTKASEVPGLAEHGLDVTRLSDLLRMRQSLEQMRKTACTASMGSIVFYIPGGVGCVAPVYELALMTESWLRSHDCDRCFEISVVTAEEQPGEAYGHPMSEMLRSRLLAHGIVLRRQCHVEWISPQCVSLRGGETIHYDLLVAHPPQVSLVAADFVPRDARGFIRTEPRSHRIVGCPRAYAVGDVTSCPIKQGFLALASAHDVVDEVCTDLFSETFTRDAQPLHRMVIGEADDGIFAQLACRPDGTVDDDDPRTHTGSSRLWSLGKRLVGRQVMARVQAGEPLLDGLAHRGLEAGVDMLMPFFAM
jgi:NADH dehydrogenase FAD-containing subunit